MWFRVIITGVFWSVLSVVQAQPNAFNDHYAKYMEGYDTRDLSKMKAGSESLRTLFPDEFAGHYLHAYYQICAGEVDKAQTLANRAYAIDPLSPYPYMVKAYAAFVADNTDAAIKNIHYAVQLRSHKNLDDIHKDIETIAFFTKKDFSSFDNILTKLQGEGVMNPDLALEFDQCFVGVTKGTPCDNIDVLAAKFNAMRYPNPMVNKLVLLTKAVDFYVKGNIADTKKQFDVFLDVTKGDKTMAWKRSYAGWFLSILKNDEYDHQGALLAINRALADYRELGFPSNQLASLQLHKIHVLGNLGDKQQEKLQLAYELEQTANQLDNDYFRAKAYNTIGAYHLFDGAQSDRNKSGEYLTKAYNLATKINDVYLTREVNTNYVIIKAKQGLYADAERITEETAQGYIEESLFSHAQNLYNNLGFIFYDREAYTHAIGQFEKSIALGDSVKNGLNAKQKLAYMNKIAGVYAGLIMSYKHTDNTEKVFRLQEQSRSGYLKALLSGNTAVASIADAQRALGPDEVLLTYTVGRPGEIIVTAITNQQASVRYNYPVDELLRFKKAYTDRIKQVPPQLNPYLQNLNVDYKDGELVQYATKEAAYKKEDFVAIVEWTRQLLESAKPELEHVQQDFLRLWYTLTLQPVQDILEQYPNVLISTASELNYLPFEAFMNPNNRYFIESHDVRYIPNTTIWQFLKGRTYPDSRKQVLAFGGAIFQPSGNVAPTVRGIEDFYRVSDAINKKISAGDFNLKTELEAVGFGGANYLAGTLKEVQYVKTLADDIATYTGYEMSESRLKRMDAAGELKQYKNLLISTHGFTDDIIPELSGVMFSQPPGGDGNEDTFLLAPEIAKLNLNANLVVLSACDTGIGKLYGGEGINGLNSAFLIAGANATLLSLWPVDDAGTALTMQNLFKKVVQENAGSAETLGAIKRTFIQGGYGELYKQPKFWAPFIYNGI